MDSKIFRNSYVVFIISFVLFYTLFYLLGIGLITEYENDKPVVKMGWRYPLALSIFVWIIWHFYVYPSEDIIYERQSKKYAAYKYDNSFSPERPLAVTDNPTQGGGSLVSKFAGMTEIPEQKFNMKNWN